MQDNTVISKIINLAVFISAVLLIAMEVHLKGINEIDELILLIAMIGTYLTFCKKKAIVLMPLIALVMYKVSDYDFNTLDYIHLFTCVIVEIIFTIVLAIYQKHKDINVFKTQAIFAIVVFMICSIVSAKIVEYEMLNYVIAINMNFSISLFLHELILYGIIKNKIQLTKATE